MTRTSPLANLPHSPRMNSLPCEFDSLIVLISVLGIAIGLAAAYIIGSKVERWFFDE